VLSCLAEIDANTFADYENHVRERLSRCLTNRRNDSSGELLFLFVGSAVSHVTCYQRHIFPPPSDFFQARTDEIDQSGNEPVSASFSSISEEGLQIGQKSIQRNLKMGAIRDSDGEIVVPPLMVS
jgi:hypothetical protein